MRVIGITGGVGAGKSTILSYLEKNPAMKVVRTDETAHDLCEPGGSCFEPLLDILTKDILSGDGTIDRKKMAAKIFSDKALLSVVNDLIHPAVKKFVLDDIDKERTEGVYEWYFLEAALLIEEGYDKICDELWYIYADDEVRRERLRSSRGYTDEKIDSIMASQADDSVFRKYCAHVIDNSGDKEKSIAQLEELLKSY
ncbi:dephospho-CoA kinase [Lachnospiraceae bacterium]|nr:dephospho-CoA kinase [Lachnospiraceae bacterium]